MAIGDPHTRPNEDMVFVPNSFGLERDARDWEACTLVPWALHLPRGAGAQDIEELLLEALKLERGAVTVTVHQPEPYLIRFERQEHCEKARSCGRFQRRGIDICLRRWRSLTHALGMRIFYRVRLYLDGIPGHAWTPEIVERVIGRRCALQCINTDLVQPLDTRHIDLWAWTENPSAIPKKLWLAFTHSPSDEFAAVAIFQQLPDQWQHGVRYEVFIHVGAVEDYTAAAHDLQGAISNPTAFRPVRRGYAWRYGLADGSPRRRALGFQRGYPCRPTIQLSGGPTSWPTRRRAAPRRHGTCTGPHWASTGP